MAAPEVKQTSMEDFATPKTGMRLALDLDKVARFVDKFAPFLPTANLRANQFGTGTSNPTYLIWSESNPASKFVLRRQPAGELLEGAHQLDREFKVLKFLQETPVPTAKMYAYSDDRSVVGAAFYIMEAVPGRVLDDGGASLSAEDRVKLWDSAASAAAALHDVDYRGLTNFAKEGCYTRRLVNTWTKQHDAVDALVQQKLGRQCLSDEMRHVESWLLARRPMDEPTSLVHGDLGLHNFIVHPTEPKISAVLDWEMATFGHPFIDMNYMAGNLTNGWRSKLGSMALPDPSALEGTPTEWEFAESYFKKRGIQPCSQVDWHFFSCVNLFRSAAIAQGVLARGLKGTASSGDTKNAIFQDSYIACVKGAIQAVESSSSKL
mmetsp:Transcript_107328/g.189799  ORF Transcript_107328/g.189799 Transcript_107328/m.189799 type:complete len:378 (+) Transcript_107328:55-1188(+)